MAALSSEGAPFHNFSNIENRQYGVKGHKFAELPDDTGSGTTASATSQSPRGSSLASECDVPAKTSLKSLQSRAKMFVPTGVPEAADPAMMLPPPPCMPTSGKDRLADIIRNTVGGELWNLSMMDYMSYTGSWNTAVEITIPELNASMYNLLASQDVQAIDAARQINQAQAIQSLAQALQGLAPNMVLQPPDHTAQICVEFCAADRNMLCREFSHFASCPRAATCRWAHAMMETFMINFIMAPLAPSGCGRWTCGTQVVIYEPILVINEPETTGQWVPNPAPMPPTASVPLTSMSANTQCLSVHDFDNTSGPDRLSGGKDTTDGKIQTVRPLPPDKRPKNPRPVSKKKWADIESDDEAECISFLAP